MLKLLLLILCFIFNVFIQIKIGYNIIIYSLINGLIGWIASRVIINGIICKHEYIIDYYLRSPKRQLPIYKCKKCNKMKIGKISFINKKNKKNVKIQRS